MALESSRGDVSIDASLGVCLNCCGTLLVVEEISLETIPMECVSYKLIACYTVFSGAISSGRVTLMGAVGDKDKEGEASLGVFSCVPFSGVNR